MYEPALQRDLQLQAPSEPKHGGIATMEIHYHSLSAQQFRHNCNCADIVACDHESIWIRIEGLQLSRQHLGQVGF